MTSKEKYEFVLKNIAQMPSGLLEINELDYFPKYMGDTSKYEVSDKDIYYNISLTDKATDSDYEEYVKYLLAYAGLDESEVFKQFTNFGKKE
jgi:hypothetical protein